MIRILRNISVRLWITTLFTIPLIFYILPKLARFFPDLNPLITGLAITAGIVVVISFLMDFLAKKIVINLIKEGQTWERSGIIIRAEKNYIKALRIYDTSLLGPFSAKKTAKKISGTIAKFQLNSCIANQNFKLGTLVYLKMNPLDSDVAQLWLTQLRQSNIVTSFEQEILSLLAEKHYASKILSVLMVDIFLGLERKDYIAKKLYQHLQKDPVLEKKYAQKIEDMIGRPDETMQKEVSFLLPGKKLESKKKIQSVINIGISCLQSLYGLLGAVADFFIISLSKVYRHIKDNERTQFYLKTGFFSIVIVWLLFLMISTMSHIFKSKTIEQEKSNIQIQVSKPFTIQVAAYLKLKHAARYVDILKQKKIDARVKQVDGGGKTWFVVRVSEFTDQESAAAYGQKLVQQKIIDDFFVNNK